MPGSHPPSRGPLLSTTLADAGSGGPTSQQLLTAALLYVQLGVLDARKLKGLKSRHPQTPEVELALQCTISNNSKVRSLPLPKQYCMLGNGLQAWLETWVAGQGVMTCRQKGLTSHEQVSAGGKCPHLRGVVMVWQRLLDGV